MLTTVANSSEDMGFNFPLDDDGKDDGDEGCRQETVPQEMPHPQFVVTGLEKGDILELLANAAAAAAVGDVAGLTTW